MTIKQRILTGVIALPLLILFIHRAPVAVFKLLAVVLSVLALWEFYAMSLPKTPVAERVLAAVAGGILTLLILFASFSTFPAALALLFLIFAILFLAHVGALETVAARLGLLFFGFLYLSLLLAHLGLLRELPFGREWIYLVLLIVMGSDTAAYFTGVNFGRRKLYPAISPNKSVEGAVGGFAGALAGAFLAQATFFPALGLADVLVVGGAGGILGQLGDLFESMLKRSFGVKDSGRMIPGHGGLLDRLDSLLFVFAPTYYYALWVFPA